MGQPPCNETLTGFGWENGVSENEITFSTVIDPLPSGNVSYNWDFGDTNNSTDANPSHQYTSPGTYNVCLDLTLETAGVPGCTGDEFVYPANPDVRAGWTNYVIDIKQYPVGIPNPAGTNFLVFNCPEASWEMIAGAFLENALGALTPVEIVQELVNYVNVLQSNADWFAVDLGNGYYLLQLHDAYNGFQYADACGVCLTGTTGAGVNVYWTYNNAPTTTVDLQDNNYLSFGENWDCTQTEGETICLGTEQPGEPAQECTLQICETVTVPCVQEALTTMEWVGRLSGFEIIGNNTNLNLDAPSLANPAPQIMEVHANNLQGQSYLNKLHQSMGCCSTLGGTFYVQSSSPDVLSVINTGVGEWTVQLGNDGQGQIIITCADFDTLLTDTSTFLPVSGGFQWVSQVVVISGSGDLSLLTSNEIEIEVGFDETCYPGDLKALIKVFGNQESCWVSGDALWTSSTSNLFFDGSCNQFDDDPVTNDDPNLGVLFGGNQVEIQDSDMVSNSFSLKLNRPDFDCCTVFTTGSTSMGITLVDTGFAPGTTANITTPNPGEFEIAFSGGTSQGTLTVIAADFISVLEDSTTWDDINCGDYYQWLSQPVTFIGSADLNIDTGYILVKIEIVGLENDCGLTLNKLKAVFRING